MVQQLGSIISHNASNTSSLKALESTNCMVHLPKEKIALIKGLNDYIIVDDGKVLAIVPKSEEQNIKGWSKEIIEKFGQDFS